MNGDLTREYTNDEIMETIFQMGPTKASGPDGFPASFYQTNWDFFGNEICQAARFFLEGRVIAEGLCDSIIVLISKVANPVLLKNFKTIRLCNVLYKIASKVLANWPKIIKPLIIYKHQSALVSGRLIRDNALITYECLHTVKQQQSKRPFFAMKVDMMKAYDHVEWKYVGGMTPSMPKACRTWLVSAVEVPV
jgi:hypothetical protein